MRGRRPRPLGMRDDGDDAIRVVDNLKIESVVSVHSPLPYIVGSTVLFGAQWGMPEIVAQQVELFPDQRLKLGRQVFVIPCRSARKVRFHLSSVNFFPSSVSSHAWNSSALLNAGETRPARMSASPSAMAASLSGWRGAISWGMSTMRSPSRSIVT